MTGGRFYLPLYLQKVHPLIRKNSIFNKIKTIGTDKT